MTKETSIDCCGFRTGPCSVNRCAHILRVLTRDPADSNATRFFLPVLLGVESCEHSARSGGCCQGLKATSFGVRWQAKRDTALVPCLPAPQSKAPHPLRSAGALRCRLTRSPRVAYKLL